MLVGVWGIPIKHRDASNIQQVDVATWSTKIFNGVLMSNIIVLTAESFDDVIKSTDLVMVDFWAPWCGPCKMLNPAIEALSAQYDGKVKICKLNTDGNENIAAKFGVRSIPTLLMFKNGEVVNQLIGVLPKDKIESMINQYL
jgi:thioredoxin 1